MAHDVVISYSRRNRDIADRFAALLQERGVDVWYDRMIRTGADWRDEIARAIANSRAFVILFSAESNESEELKKEFAIAERRNLLIAPIRIENVEPSGFFEYELSRRQWFDAFVNRDAQLILAADQLVEQLKSGAAEVRNPADEPQPKPAEVRQPAPNPTYVHDPAPSGRGSWIYLGLAILNFLLGLLYELVAIWPFAYAGFVWFVAKRRPTPEVVKWHSWAQALVAIAILGTVSPGSVGPLAPYLLIPLVFAGVALSAYLAQEVYVRKRPVDFWAVPVVGSTLTAMLVFLVVVGIGHRFSTVFGMIVANAPFVIDAWNSRKRPTLEP